VVVISDRALVKQLIDKKASIYSDRPTSYVSNDLITHGDHLLVMKYGEKWRLFRKLIHQKFREELCEKEHVKLVEAEAIQMCQDFMTHPEGLMYHPKRFSNSIIMSLCKALFSIQFESFGPALTGCKYSVSAPPPSTPNTCETSTP
jgi:cytochrome P450